jgi:hypothetical protein
VEPDAFDTGGFGDPFERLRDKVRVDRLAVAPVADEIEIVPFGAGSETSACLRGSVLTEPFDYKWGSGTVRRPWTVFVSVENTSSAPTRWSVRLDYESHATGLDRNELGALLVAAGLSSARDHALVSLLALNGLRVSEALGADIDALGLERGHRTLTVTRKAGRSSRCPWHREWVGPSTSRSASVLRARSSWTGPVSDSTGMPPGGSCVASPARQG